MFELPVAILYLIVAVVLGGAVDVVMWTTSLLAGVLRWPSRCCRDAAPGLPVAIVSARGATQHDESPSRAAIGA
jgi:hypothetical protein